MKEVITISITEMSTMVNE